jgi:eukaryotic-like serine/threonine-protein kinase
LRLSSNPHVITIYDLGKTDQSQPYLVTEYLSGKSLSEEMEQPHLPSRTWVLGVALQILSALIDSHAKGVVHRDLKPANIFVMSTMAIPLLIKVLDFGLSRNADVPMSPEFATQLGVPIGTPKYIAPEVLAGDPARPASDVYALGLIIYELATGQYPYAVQSASDCLRAHLSEVPPTFPKVGVPFPEPFERIVFQMLEKKEFERPTAVECYRSLSRIESAIDFSKMELIKWGDEHID